MLTGNIKAYIASVLVVLLLMVLVPTFIHNATLQRKVKGLEDRNTQLISDSILRKMAVENMRTAVAEQELKIKEFEVAAQQMAEARLKAQQQAEQRIEQLTNRIAWLEQDKGASCTAAGIGKTILDEVLP
jgi:TolA-binding protein